MKLLANIVAKNEADRYLDACLAWITPHVDGVFVYDDQSTDETVDVALSHGAKVATRTVDVSFLENEGTFRYSGWLEMMSALHPSAGDWIVGLDADEFPVPADLRPLAKHASRQGYGAIDIHIPEIFSLVPFSHRQDGYWATISSVRMAAFLSGSQTFPWGAARGVFPSYAYHARRLEADPEYINLLHVGYAAPEDRINKYDRYRKMHRTGGHASKHVSSIMKTPHLKEWDGEVPHIWRGVL